MHIKKIVFFRRSNFSGSYKGNFMNIHNKTAHMCGFIMNAF